MRGVDRGDQRISCYNIGRKSKKWWKRVFSYLIECVLLNAFILERHANPSLYDGTRRDFLAFRTEVAHQLIGSFHFRQRAGCPSSKERATAAWLNVQLNHWPVQVEKKLLVIQKGPNNSLDGLK